MRCPPGALHGAKSRYGYHIMAQRGLCSEGRASHHVVDVSATEGCPAGALHGGGVKGQHAEP
jgi:hypothetical protein